MHFKILLLALLLMQPATAFELPPSTTQCIVGTTEDWDSSTVTLNFYEKKAGAWKPIGPSWKARLGANGLIWGNGLHPIPSGAPTKREGDNRSPAGVFAIGGAWGYAKSIQKHPKLPYRQVTTRDLWVEDPGSPSYNQHIILNHEPHTAWEEKQQMRQNDFPHSLKLFIAHNSHPKIIPNAGSSIFFHIWRNGGARASAGCTTMEKPKLEWLISKIDPTRQPLYILLPKEEYEKLRGKWKLP